MTNADEVLDADHALRMAIMTAMTGCAEKLGSVVARADDREALCEAAGALSRLAEGRAALAFRS
jgi:hypothetical protein